MITIKNMNFSKPTERWHVRVDREAILGNPFVMEKEEDRDQVILQYKEWLEVHITAKTPYIMDELRRIKKLHDDNGNIELYCWCAPQACHSEVLKEIILRMK